MADSDDESSLHDAAYRNDVKRLRRLLSQGADPNLPDPREGEGGKTPLHHLCLGYGYDEEGKKRMSICFELLRAAGADVHARDNHGNVPLHVVAGNSSHLVQRLIESGANLEAVSDDGKTPLHSAAGLFGAQVTVSLLIKAGAELNARDSRGRTPLHCAAFGAETTNVLIRAGAEVTARDNRGCTPLHHAARAGCADAACLLLRAGAEVNARDSDSRPGAPGYTPLEAAVSALDKLACLPAEEVHEVMKVFPILLRAGATLPDPSRPYLLQEAEPWARWYLKRVIDEGGFANLARLHLNKVTETFAPKFASRGLPPEIVRHVVSFWLHAGYYDEGGERDDEAKYDSLIADITRKVAEMASLRVVPRASRRARKLRHALEADLDSDDDWTACS